MQMLLLGGTGGMPYPDIGMIGADPVTPGPSQPMILRERKPFLPRSTAAGASHLVGVTVKVCFMLYVDRIHLFCGVAAAFDGDCEGEAVLRHP
ncbi:hypothetical protein [Bradyrhizobium sp. CCBAU 51753]|uniref:hypothetical protein n=1 Tax=Bradyrhizobium sp. CCBAU 51753 TaxID=1325100 RepID=UPI00188CF007|nr:hypothetical protein [Bradyrhizobium sp. CCBAU 51753]QOZ24004.1 hypothetical protein XH93_10690 [Bradyrhizobium sp. CCBAU 51753]